MYYINNYLCMIFVAVVIIIVWFFLCIRNSLVSNKGSFILFKDIFAVNVPQKCIHVEIELQCKCNRETEWKS